MADMTDGLVYGGDKIFSPGGQPVVNLSKGGTHGFVSHLDYLDASSPQVLRPIVPIVAHVPTVFQKAAGGSALFKKVFETCVQTMSGIDFGYTIETSEYPVGNDGQVGSAPLSGRRSEVAPSIVIPEVIGNVFWNFFRAWMRIIVDCDTQASSLVGVTGDTSDEGIPHLISAYSMDLLLIQYDMSLKVNNIIDGFIITQMFPVDIGQYGITKEVASATRPDRNVTFKGIMQHNGNTLRVAQNVARVLKLHTVDPYWSKPVVQNVDSILTDSALRNEISMIDSEWGAIPTA